MRYFTSDLHFGHRNIITHCNRPDTDVDAMNARLIAAVNTHVGIHDQLFQLGDVALGRLADNLPLVGQLHGTQHLIAGNHDRCWGGHHRRPARVARAVGDYLAAGFTTVSDRMAVTLTDGTPLLLAHLPYAGDHTADDRYATRRPVDGGLWLACGHVHDAWLQRGRQINVGIDIWQRPVSEDELAALIAAGPADRDDLGDLPATLR